MRNGEPSAMPGYRCYLFDADDHITRRVEYQADTDALAIIEGRHRYAANAIVFGEFGFEIWQEGRLIYSEGRASSDSR